LDPLETVRVAGPVVAALGAALLVDRMARRRGLDPPGFAQPGRRITAILLVAFAFWVGVFAALGNLGRGEAPDLTGISDWQLFTLQLLFLAVVLGWFALGFAGTGDALPGNAAPPLGARFAVQLGFATPRRGLEMGVGAVAGVAAWLVVLGGVLLFALLLSTLFGEELLPQSPPAVIPWIASRPVLLRLGIALSAGIVEETFFRGFLQPRIGIVLSTLLFALAHLSYDQPIMLVGVGLLSILYGLLVRWRRNLWPAIVAHFLFDAIQLLIVIPAVLRLLPQGAP
jgi:membrane protease YdiL (CAAX protease family)